MGTHPIFESDFDCLTELKNTKMSDQSLAQALEAEAMADMFNKMVESCHNKCIGTNYPEGELNKAESVCVDRCSSKFMEMHDKIGQVITEWSQKNENLMKAQQGPLPV